jgi:flagellar hook-associated protein 1 FlgK
MTTMFSSFDLAQKSLAAQQFALSITQKNVANINNPSYTRQDVNFSSDYSELPLYGVPGASIESNRNRFLDYSISNEQSSLSQSTVQQEALKQVDTVMNGLDSGGLSESLSNFFNSFSSLSSNTTSLALRQQVLTSASTLSRKFQQVYKELQQIQVSQDQEIQKAVKEVNSIAARISDLNKEVARAQNVNSEDAFTLRDERQQLLEDLSKIMEISYFEDESGSITVTAKQGNALVLADKSFNLELSPISGSAFQGITLQGTDITQTIKSGSLGGYLKMRDETLSGYMNKLDDLAAGVISRVNTVHAMGVDLDSFGGGDFFVPFLPSIPGTNAGAASSISVAITDPRGIAAAAWNGDIANNENAKLLASIGTDKLFSDNKENAAEFYAGLIFQVGADEKDAEESIATQNSLLEQLMNQRESSSGVSLNEEAVNLMKYQKAYQASARYVSVWDDLSKEILQLL